MIEIDNTILSLDVIQTPFFCNLSVCKGACCVEGDSGAPLENSEIETIKENIHIIEKYLPEKSKKLINESYFYYIDSENDKVTQLNQNKECVFVYFEEDIAKCAIETAYNNDKIPIKKPISCHLYPIRVKKYPLFFALNYHSWDICISARTQGQIKNIYVYDFCKDALCRKFGKDWYNKLMQALEYISNNNQL